MNQSVLAQITHRTSFYFPFVEIFQEFSLAQPARSVRTSVAA